MSSTIRFFTSATLRPHEEVAGEVLDWLARHVTVEFSDGEPLCGVWRSTNGERRVCWYATTPTQGIVSAHLERYGEDAFWVIDRSALGERRLSVFECDQGGNVIVRRRWEFDGLDMPVREEELAPDGTVHFVRTYECTSNGVVSEKTEAVPGKPVVVLPRPHRFPAPALAGEPFPCGRNVLGSDSEEGARVVESIAHNSYQVRAYVAYRRGERWERAIATLATTKAGWSAEMRDAMAFAGPGVAPLVLIGRLEGKLPRNYPFFGVVEALPDGRSLDEWVATQMVSQADAIAVALEVGDVARRAHTRGHQLGGIRPDTTYARREGDRLSFTGIMFRGPTVIRRTYAGEAILWPPVPHADWRTDSDIQGLAQLVWFLVTGGHPFLDPDDIRWDESWNEFRHQRRRRQRWTGPAALGEVLSRVLFEPNASVDLETFLGDLQCLRV